HDTLGPPVAPRVLTYFATPPATPTPFPELTAREREVLDLLAAGHSNHQIAQQLSLSVKTVANHISAIFAKLQVADRTQAILRARDAGLGHPDQPGGASASRSNGWGRRGGG